MVLAAIGAWDCLCLAGLTCGACVGAAAEVLWDPEDAHFEQAGCFLERHVWELAQQHSPEGWAEPLSLLHVRAVS